MEIPMSVFVEYAVATGPSKAGKVLEAMRMARSEYDPRTHYWGPLRTAIIRMHERGADATALDPVLKRVAPEKRENYKAHIAGYKKFLGRKDLPWIGVPKGGRWRYEGLIIRVNPDLGLQIRGGSHYLRLHFKAGMTERLPRNKALATAGLLRDVWGATSAIGLIDVRNGRLVTPAVDPKVETWLRAEAASFIQMWKDLKR